MRNGAPQGQKAANDLARLVQLARQTKLDARPASIGLIWQILYPIILFRFGFVFVQAI